MESLLEGAECMALVASTSHLEQERRLVEAAKLDPEAFALLYERNVDAIYAYVLHRVRDTAIAEDIVSETFHRALENLGAYEWRGVPFAAWLYRIASNAIAARFRRDPQASLDEAAELYDSEPGPEQSTLQNERSRELQQAIAGLPAEQQQVIILRYGQDLKNKEIAEIMGRSEGAIKQLLHRATNGLQKRLTASRER